MQKINLTEMKQEYFDVLKEIGNIGAGNATTALAHLLNCKVDMSVPQVRLLDFKDAGAIMGGEEQIMAGIYLLVEGDVNGSIMFLLKKESAKHLIAKLMGLPNVGKDESDVSKENEELTEIEASALKEIGNIITGSYLNSLSSLTNLSIYPSVPYLAIDMAGALLSVPAIDFGVMGDKMLLIQTQFSDEMALDGFFILVPDLESYERILLSIGM